jgi:hypothetical protein
MLRITGYAFSRTTRRKSGPFRGSKNLGISLFLAAQFRKIVSKRSQTVLVGGDLQSGQNVRIKLSGRKGASGGDVSETYQGMHQSQIVVDGRVSGPESVCDWEALWALSTYAVDLGRGGLRTLQLRRKRVVFTSHSLEIFQQFFISLAFRFELEAMDDLQQQINKGVGNLLHPQKAERG